MKTSESIVQILSPASKVWLALTVPELVKQWQYGADLLTTWTPGTPIVFRNEWNGQVFEQKGTVLEFIPASRLKYSLFFPRPDLQDVPENHFFMIYELTESGGVSLAGSSAGPAEMIATDTAQVASVPEPGGLTLLTLSAAGLIRRRRRRTLR